MRSHLIGRNDLSDLYALISDIQTVVVPFK